MTIYYPPTTNALQKTLGAQLDQGTTASATLNNTTGVQNKPGVMLIDRVDANGNLKSSSNWEWVIYQGTSGSTVTTLTRGVGGSSDQDHAVGAIVEFVMDITWAQGFIDTFVTEHGTDGTHDATKVAMLAGTQEFTGDKTFSGAVDLSGSTLTLPTLSVRNNPRTTTETSSATPTINTDNTDIHTITALATAITSMTTNLSGTPVNGQKLIIRITDSGSGQNITWGASFESMGATLPTAITASKTRYVGLIYSSTTSKWQCVASIEQA